jgi:hypothetical protein
MVKRPAAVAVPSAAPRIDLLEEREALAVLLKLDGYRFKAPSYLGGSLLFDLGRLTHTKSSIAFAFPRQREREREQGASETRDKAGEVTSTTVLISAIVRTTRNVTLMRPALSVRL